MEELAGVSSIGLQRGCKSFANGFTSLGGIPLPPTPSSGIVPEAGFAQIDSRGKMEEDEEDATIPGR